MDITRCLLCGGSDILVIFDGDSFVMECHTCEDVSSFGLDGNSEGLKIFKDLNEMERLWFRFDKLITSGSITGGLRYWFRLWKKNVESFLEREKIRRQYERMDAVNE